MLSKQWTRDKGLTKTIKISRIVTDVRTTMILRMCLLGKIYVIVIIIIFMIDDGKSHQMLDVGDSKDLRKSSSSQTRDNAVDLVQKLITLSQLRITIINNHQYQDGWHCCQHIVIIIMMIITCTSSCCNATRVPSRAIPSIFLIYILSTWWIW